MKIIHEKSKCISCGACAALCPKKFAMDENGSAQLLDSTLNPATNNYELEVEEMPSCVKEAAESCPVEIIHIIEK